MCNTSGSLSGSIFTIDLESIYFSLVPWLPIEYSHHDLSPELSHLPLERCPCCHSYIATNLSSPYSHSDLKMQTRSCYPPAQPFSGFSKYSFLCPTWSYVIWTLSTLWLYLLSLSPFLITLCPHHPASISWFLQTLSLSLEHSLYSQIFICLVCLPCWTATSVRAGTFSVKLFFERWNELSINAFSPQRLSSASVMAIYSHCPWILCPHLF